MTILDAEKNFREGLVALVEARHVDAAGHFDEAIKLDKARGGTDKQMRYLSYYGLSVALAQGPTKEAVQACEVAIRRDFFSPDLLLNLGKVYLMAGRRTKALAVLERGLKIAPKHKGLRSAVSRADRRRRRTLPWLQRSHPANYWLGKLRGSGTRDPQAVTAEP